MTMRMSVSGNNKWPVQYDDQLMMMMIMSASNHQRLFDSNQGSKAAVKKQRRCRKLKTTKGGEIHGKRKLTEHQGTQLEVYFKTEPKLETERKVKIATELGLEPRQVAVWFQNRRARWKCNKLEDEYADLRTSHDRVLSQKVNLEAQVLELSGRLLEAKCEIQRLSERKNEGNTPSSSCMMMSSMEHYDNKEFEEVEDVRVFEEVEDVRVFEKECVQVMDCYWMNNINTMYDLM